MMIFFCLVLGTGALFCISHAQPRVEFDGYVINVPAYLALDDELASLQHVDQKYLVDVTRLRLRPVLKLSGSGYIALEYEAAAIYQSGNVSTFVPSSDDRHQLFDLTWVVTRGAYWQIQHTIDRLYYRQQIGAVDCSIGRQRIAWGSGRIWNPTDLFNPLNPTTFAKIEKDGVDAAIVRCTLGTLSDATFVVNPQRDRPGNYALRMRTNTSGYDLAGLAGYVDQRVVLGGDVAGNLFKAGVRSEVLFSLAGGNAAPDFFKAIVGADHQWSAELYTLIEYHYNGEGKTNPAEYDLARLLSGEILNVAVHYLAVSASYLVHPLVTATAACTGNLDDGSAYIALSAVYVPADEWSVTLGGQLFAGSPGDEYRYYPGSAYARVSLFF